jgi:predicted DCC family thiol-disulfide oxidoreductase YuxK
VSDDLPQRILLYDGQCGLCDRFVQWVLGRDPGGTFHFAALQGETAARLRVRHSEIPEGLETAVLVDQGEVLLRSQAVFRVLALMGGLWGVLAWLRVLPVGWTDPGYRWVASVRHRLKGGAASCRLPGPGEAARFLP